MLTKFTALAMGVLLSVSAMAADMATLTRQAQNGDVSAQFDLADEYYQQGNHAKAFEWYTKAAHQGHAGAQNNLGVMYDNGHGVRQDYQKAIEWYTKAAHQGIVGAQYNLGVMYYKGKGVSQDYHKAYEWYTKAANQGNVGAQYYLGVIKNYFRQACGNWETEACYHYASLSQQGH